MLANLALTILLTTQETRTLKAIWRDIEPSVSNSVRRPDRSPQRNRVKIWILREGTQIRLVKVHFGAMYVPIDEAINSGLKIGYTINGPEWLKQLQNLSEDDLDFPHFYVTQVVDLTELDEDDLYLSEYENEFEVRSASTDSWAKGNSFICTIGTVDDRHAIDFVQTSLEIEDEDEQLEKIEDEAAEVFFTLSPGKVIATSSEKSLFIQASGKDKERYKSLWRELIIAAKETKWGTRRN